MDMPVSMPTDNLYKFMALAGLVILSISVIFPFKLLNEYSFEGEKIRAKIKILNLERDYLLEDTKNLEDETYALAEEVKNIKKEVDKELDNKEEFIENQKKYYMEIAQEQLKKSSLLIKMREKIEKRVRLLDTKTTEIDNKNEINKYLINKISRFKFISTFGTVLGILLTSLGFHFWYTKLQVYQDIIIQRKAEKEK